MGAFSSIDVALEEADLLKKLESDEPPGVNTTLTRDCNEVRFSTKKHYISYDCSMKHKSGGSEEESEAARKSFHKFPRKRREVVKLSCNHN